MKLQTTAVKYSIHTPKEHPLFGTDAIHVTADSEGGGVYFVIEQVCPTLIDPEHFGQGKMCVEFEEVEAILEVCKKIKEEIS